MKQQLEQELIDWCAPTLAGLKPANLFRCPASPALFHSIREWNEKLKPFGLRIRVMKWCRRTKSCLIYVCRWDWICREVQRKDVRVFLRQCGYDLSGGMESVICQLARRLCLRADFPHEIGIFIGYPLRDVVGFICNKGQNYSCCGHWKSYGDAEQAQQTFDAYKKCTACYQHLYEKGVPLLKLIAAA